MEERMTEFAGILTVCYVGGYADQREVMRVVGCGAELGDGRHLCWTVTCDDQLWPEV